MTTFVGIFIIQNNPVHLAIKSYYMVTTFIFRTTLLSSILFLLINNGKCQSNAKLDMYPEKIVYKNLDIGDFRLRFISVYDIPAYRPNYRSNTNNWNTLEQVTDQLKKINPETFLSLIGTQKNPLGVPYESTYKVLWKSQGLSHTVGRVVLSNTPGSKNTLVKKLEIDFNQHIYGYFNDVPESRKGWMNFYKTNIQQIKEYFNDMGISTETNGDRLFIEAINNLSNWKIGFSSSNDDQICDKIILAKK